VSCRSRVQVASAKRIYFLRSRNKFCYRKFGACDFRVTNIGAYSCKTSDCQTFCIITGVYLSYARLVVRNFVSITGAWKTSTLTKIGRSTRVEDGSKANRAFNNVPDFYQIERWIHGVVMFLQYCVSIDESYIYLYTYKCMCIYRCVRTYIFVIISYHFWKYIPK
jgi:hypothetical protein